MPNNPTIKAFNYTAQGVSYAGAQCHGGAQGRILMMPDWEGCHSRWASEIAQLYASTCQAEVILTDHYGAECHRPSFEHAAALNESLYAKPDAARAMLRRMVAALEDRWTAGGPLVVVGFCSGGSFAFETGRSGAEVDAVFSIHGTPSTVDPLQAPGNYPVFTMIHGGADPIISGAALESYRNEMQKNNIQWALHIISHAKHSFTRFDSPRQNYGIGYSRRAEIEARHLVLAQILSLRETNAMDEPLRSYA